MKSINFYPIKSEHEVFINKYSFYLFKNKYNVKIILL